MKVSDNTKASPLLIICKNCGRTAGFDIIKQSYRCSACGDLTGVQEAKDAVYNWTRLKKEEILSKPLEYTMEECSCQTCGARIVFAEGEATDSCSFCGSRFVRSEFSERDQLPEMIIPFFITPEEARKRMLEWGHKHRKTVEGRSLVSSMGQFQGCYLPYRIVKGPVHATVERHGNSRKYECGGYIECSAVNTSRQLDNLVLNDMEPFDWSKAAPFEYAYIAGTPVKLNDSTDAEINARIVEEITSDFTPEVEKVMQTSGVTITPDTNDLTVINALLPVYFIISGKLTAVMNGQTGRIAVYKKRTKVSNPWIIEPLVYTTLMTLLMGWLFGWNPELLCYSFAIFGAINFAVFGDGRTSLVRRISFKTKEAAAKRENGELVIDEADNILKNPYDNTPVFYEANEQGKKVPVRLRFYTPGRLFGMLFNSLITMFLPVIIAALFRLADMEEGESFMDSFHPEYAAAWFIPAAFIVFLYYVKGIRNDVYDHPFIYEILPDGHKRLMGKRRDRKLTILSMFGIGQIDSNGKRIGLFGALLSLGAGGLFLFVIILFLLLGSTLAIFI